MSAVCIVCKEHPVQFACSVCKEERYCSTKCGERDWNDFSHCLWPSEFFGMTCEGNSKEVPSGVLESHARSVNSPFGSFTELTGPLIPGLEKSIELRIVLLDTFSDTSSLIRIVMRLLALRRVSAGMRDLIDHMRPTVFFSFFPMREIKPEEENVLKTFFRMLNVSESDKDFAYWMMTGFDRPRQRLSFENDNVIGEYYDFLFSRDARPILSFSKQLLKTELRRGTHAELVAHILNISKIWSPKMVFDDALQWITSRHVEMVRVVCDYFMGRHFEEISTFMIDYKLLAPLLNMVKTGTLDAFTYYMDNLVVSINGYTHRPRVNQIVMSAVTTSGRVDILRVVLQNRARWTDETFDESLARERVSDEVTNPNMVLELLRDQPIMVVENKLNAVIIAPEWAELSTEKKTIVNLLLDTFPEAKVTSAAIYWAVDYPDILVRILKEKRLKPMDFIRYWDNMTQDIIRLFVEYNVPYVPAAVIPAGVRYKNIHVRDRLLGLCAIAQLKDKDPHVPPGAYREYATECLTQLIMYRHYEGSKQLLNLLHEDIDSREALEFVMTHEVEYHSIAGDLIRQTKDTEFLKSMLRLPPVNDTYIHHLETIIRSRESETEGPSKKRGGLIGFPVGGVRQVYSLVMLALFKDVYLISALPDWKNLYLAFSVNKSLNRVFETSFPFFQVLENPNVGRSSGGRLLLEFIDFLSKFCTPQYVSYAKFILFTYDFETNIIPVEHREMVRNLVNTHLIPRRVPWIFNRSEHAEDKVIKYCIINEMDDLAVVLLSENKLVNTHRKALYILAVAMNCVKSKALLKPTGPSDVYIKVNYPNFAKHTTAKQWIELLGQLNLSLHGDQVAAIFCNMEHDSEALEFFTAVVSDRDLWLYDQYHPDFVREIIRRGGENRLRMIFPLLKQHFQTRYLITNFNQTLERKGYRVDLILEYLALYDPKFKFHVHDLYGITISATAAQLEQILTLYTPHFISLVSWLGLRTRPEDWVGKDDSKAVIRKHFSYLYGDYASLMDVKSLEEHSHEDRMLGLLYDGARKEFWQELRETDDLYEMFRHFMFERPDSYNLMREIFQRYPEYMDRLAGEDFVEPYADSVFYNVTSFEMDIETMRRLRAQVQRIGPKDLEVQFNIYINEAMREAQYQPGAVKRMKEPLVGNAVQETTCIGVRNPGEINMQDLWNAALEDAAPNHTLAYIVQLIQQHHAVPSDRAFMLAAENDRVDVLEAFIRVRYFSDETLQRAKNVTGSERVRRLIDDIQLARERGQAQGRQEKPFKRMRNKIQ